MKNLLIFAAICIQAIAFGQTGKIKGKVVNAISNEPIPFANVAIKGTTTGASTDIDGNYTIENVTPGTYTLEASFIGFNPSTQFEILVTGSRTSFVNFTMTENVQTLDAVEIVASPFTKTEESPVSLRTIGFDEIQRSPGGNRDISKVIQSLPGVASPPSFRNDIIIRGGAPNENRFYLDGIEVPNINHFATQGSSGGPVGLINVNFIREVDFYSGAFPANRGNALSSVFEFKQKEGNPERIKSTVTLGSSDFGLTLDGPIGKKSNFIFSARRSYLQFLFQALQLPILPTYNDFQGRYEVKFNQKNKIVFIGLGAIDDFKLNPGVLKADADSATLESNQYILANLPVSTQWNYAVGANYTHFSKKSFQTVVLSRNMLNNNSVKYANNDESSEANLLQQYNSQESENKLRVENTWRDKGWKVNYGGGMEFVRYTNSTYNKISSPLGAILIDFNSKLNFFKYSLFGQASKGLFEQRMTVSLGLRTDFNSYSKQMANPINQLSPRLSLAYSLTPKVSLNFNTGRYFQLPAYTILGYRDMMGDLVNKANDVTYIAVNHIVAGLEYNPNRNLRMTMEGFYKQYNNYPFSLRDSVSLANLGADFGVIGNEPVVSSSKGRSYGVEFLAQQRLFKGFYGIGSLTLVRSEFTTKTDEFKPSAWDNGFIVNLQAGKKFKKNWEIGARYRILGGAPYTPYNVQQSALISNWDVRNAGILDYNNINTLRNGVASQLDMRIDKKFFLKKFTLNLYFDIQNALNQKFEAQPNLNVRRDAAGLPLVDPNDPTRYQTYQIANTSGTVLPSIGMLLEF